MSGREVFDLRAEGGFHVSGGLLFRRVERHCDGVEANGGANGNRAERGIWWDVELIVCEFVPGPLRASTGEHDPGHYEVVRRQTIDEGSWCSVVSSMSMKGEDFFTVNLAECLHTGGLR